MLKTLSSIFVLLSITFCTSLKTNLYQPRILSANEATQRAQVISNVHYDLNFNLNKESEYFDGNVKISFDLSSLAKKIRIDFKDGRILKVLTNGKEVLDFDYDKSALWIENKYLRKNKNDVEIFFEREYSKQGKGLHRFVDPKDKRVYLYSDFEPFDANEMFPSFDQPDLKARFKLTVTAPWQWQVITSVKENKVMRVGMNRIWLFDDSPIMSTYVFSLHAGPYKIWRDDTFRYPLRLMARQSLAPYVSRDFWFKITKLGFDFFERYFGYSYPYFKYDQIIVPEFNSGAMENIAAVTFNEWYVKRSAMTMSEQVKLANVILHELAHMWFGNLVTMRWWNGLWLNESFATYMASLALEQGTNFRQSWMFFHLNEKMAAYQDDAKITSHPIEVPIKNTSEAFANFDRITYGKGASVLKQLSFYIGEENFKTGLKKYFETFQNKNTEINDFLQKMEEASGKELLKWSKKWLETSHFNRLSIDWTCNKGELRVFLNQDVAGEQNVLRSHKIALAFYQLDKSQLKILQSPAVEVSGLENEYIFKSLVCPDFIEINYQDHGYLMPNYSSQQKDFILNNLKLFPEVMSRAMLLGYLWDQVLRGELSLIIYGEVALDFLQQEESADLKHLLINSLSKEFSIYLWRMKRSSAKLRKQLADVLWKELNNSQMDAYDSFSKANIFDAWINHISQDQELNLAYDLLNKKRKVNGLEIDQDRRWSLILTLSRFNFSNINKIIEREQVNDFTDRGKIFSIAAKALIPDDQNKKEWFERILNRDGKMNVSELRAAMNSFFNIDQPSLAKDFADYYFLFLQNDLKEREQAYQSIFTRYFYPLTCDQEFAKKILRFTQKERLPAYVAKNLKYAFEKEQECIRVLEASMESI